MANTRLIFLDKDKHTELICYATTNKNVVLKLTDAEGSEIDIVLDISTAIKFSKTLRTNINVAKEYNSDDDWLSDYIKEGGSNV